MNDVIKSGNIIKKIRDGKQLEEIALFARNCIFRDGPKDTLVLEILSYLKLFQPTFFEKFEDELIETMGLFFKNPSPDTLQGVVFDMYRQHIKEKYGEDYTPMQASILEQIEDKHHFSFSAPTSTGKSFVFRNLIRSASNASRTAERQQLYQKRNAEEANSIPAKYIVGYHDIPDKDLTV